MTNYKSEDRFMAVFLTGVIIYGMGMLYYVSSIINEVAK
jgi:hypothetical protein